MFHQPRRPRSIIPLLILVAASAVTSCVRARTGDPFPAATPADTIRVGIRETVPHTQETTVRALAVEEYVLGSVLAEANLSELDSGARFRLAQVQAILARTYAIANLGRHADEGFDLCSTTHCQVYRPANQGPADLVGAVTDAVTSTDGLLVTHEGRPINALFHADCGGHTSDADAVWEGASPPYLQGAPDVYCLWERHGDWRFEIDTAVLRGLLNRTPETRIGERLDTLVITRVDHAGRVLRVTLEGERRIEVRGATLRAMLTSQFGPRSIKSTRFATHRDGPRFVFEGRGFGHGVGLCQAGARARVQAGHTAQVILQHYYPGTLLERGAVGRSSRSR